MGIEDALALIRRPKPRCKGLRFSYGTNPVVSCLVFVVDPVERFHRAILDAVFSNPLICIAAALHEDAGHHAHFL